MSSKPKVLGIDALTGIAFMENVQIIRYRPVVKLPRIPMSTNVFAVLRECSISRLAERGCPNPTFAALIYIGPKPLFFFHENPSLDLINSPRVVQNLPYR